MEDIQFPDHAGRLLSRILGAVFSAVLVFSACSDQSAEHNVSVSRLQELSRSDTSLYLLDVRTAGEYDRVHLNFTSERIPYDSLSLALDRLPEDRQIGIYCLCAVGHRSGRAAVYLRSVGYERVYNVEGGLTAWMDSGFEVAKD